MIWKTAADYKIPVAPPPATNMADWCVYQSIKQNLDGADDYFVFPAGQPTMGSMYADLTSYVNGLIEMFQNFNNWFHSSTDPPCFWWRWRSSALRWIVRHAEADGRSSE